MFSHLRPMLLVALFLGLCLTGCGKSDPVLQGRLIKDGQPVTLKEEEEISITFLPKDQGPAAGADFDKDSGTFKVAGPNRKGLPPGDYKVSVTKTVYPEGKDLFAGEFSESKTMPFTIGPEGIQKIVIDLSAKTVSRE